MRHNTNLSDSIERQRMYEQYIYLKICENVRSFDAINPKTRKYVELDFTELSISCRAIDWKRLSCLMHVILFK